VLLIPVFKMCSQVVWVGGPVKTFICRDESHRSEKACRCPHSSLNGLTAGDSCLLTSLFIPVQSLNDSFLGFAVQFSHFHKEQQVLKGCAVCVTHLLFLFHKLFCFVAR